MPHFPTLRQLIARLPELDDTEPIFLPETLAAHDDDFSWLLQPKARFWVQAADAAPRMGYRPWLDVAGLRRIAQGLDADFGDDELLAALAFHLGRAPVDDTPPADTPPLAWPELPDDEARLAWYRACIAAYAGLWEGHATQPILAPASRAELDALEQRLGCALPPLLRAYHARLGALSLAERLCSVAPPVMFASIEPLADAYPGITDILEDEDDADDQWALVDELVAFGDYLGNGNLWCFHRQTGEVWYFDHDSPPMLTRMFGQVADYLDALMFKCLLQVHDAEDDDETLLRQRFGDALVEKWMY